MKHHSYANYKYTETVINKIRNNVIDTISRQVLPTLVRTIPRGLLTALNVVYGKKFNFTIDQYLANDEIDTPNNLSF